MLLARMRTVCVPKWLISKKIVVMFMASERKLVDVLRTSDSGMSILKIICTVKKKDSGGL